VGTDDPDLVAIINSVPLETTPALEYVDVFIADQPGENPFDLISLVLGWRARKRF
jgi:hypothetical protein